MPNYSIQGPDGKTYSIDGPEGASREQVIDAIQAKLSAPLAEAPKAVEDENGWIPSMHQMTHEGYLARIGRGLGERAGILEKEPEQPKEEGPTPTIGESLKAIGTQLKEHPVDVAKGLTRGIIEDPELLLPWFWEATPAKLAAILEKSGVAAKTAYGIARTGAAGAGLEATAQAAEGKYDPQAIANTGAQFAAFRAAHDVAAGTYKVIKGKGKEETVKPEDVKPEEPKPITTTTTEAAPIEGALDASHFNEEDIAKEPTKPTAAVQEPAPEVKLQEEIDRASKGLNPEPTPEEIQQQQLAKAQEVEKQAKAEKAARDLQAEQEAAILAQKAEAEAAAIPAEQNRNRATPGSINQMSKIAGSPMYERVGVDNSMVMGAPIVTGPIEIPKAQLGKKSEAIAANDTKVPVQYAVVEADSILPSNKADGTVNPEYNRDYPGLRAVVGNGRAAGIQEGFERGTTGDYVNKLKADEAHGIDPKVVEKMNKPMLVRYATEVPTDIAKISNESATGKLNVVEQAKQDAHGLDVEGIKYTPSGEIDPSTYRGFAGSLPEAEKMDMVDVNGLPTKQAKDRLNAAIFSKAYGNDELVRLHYEAADEEAKNAMKAMSEAAPSMVKLEGAGLYDIRPQVAEAAEMVVNAIRKGDKLPEVAKQMDMTVDPLSRDIFKLFADNPRKPREVAAKLKELAENMHQEATQPKEDMFGTKELRSPADIIQNVLKKEPEVDLFTQRSERGIPGGIDKEHFFDRVLRDFGPSVRGLFKRGLVDVYGDISEVPAYLRKHFGPDTRALSVLEDGKRKAIIVTNRIGAGEVREVILHEVGEHYGMRGMLGEKVYKQILDTVENLKNKDMLVKRAYDETFNTPHYKELFKTNKEEFLSEVIAKLGEQAPDHGIIKRIVQAVKTFLIKKGFITDINGAEIQDLVMHALRTAMDKDLPQVKAEGVSEAMKSERPTNPAESKRLTEKFEKLGIKDTKPHGDKTIIESLKDTRDELKDAFKAAKAEPKETKTKMIGGVSDALTNFRIKFVHFGAGLEVADVRKYKGMLNKSNGEAVASVGLTNAIKSGHIMSQVMLMGKLVYDGTAKMFKAAADPHSMRNIFVLEKQLYNKLGKVPGATLINSYFNALRSRSIQNEFEMRHGDLLALKEGIPDAPKLAKTNPDLLAKQLNDLGILDIADYDRMKTKPETLAGKLIKIYDKARADAERDFEAIIKAYKKIPDAFCVKDSNGDKHYQKVLTKDGRVAEEVPLINDDVIDEFIHEENSHPELREMMENWTSVNHNMLDNMYRAGLLNKTRYENLKSIKDYVPWFRVEDESESLHAVPTGVATLTNVSKEKKFTKGEVDKDVDNVVNNMISNVMMMGRNSIRNHAANEIVKEYGTRDANGKLKVFPKDEITKDGAVRTNIVVDGQRITIEIKDPLIAQSMLGMENIEMPMYGALGSIQQFFRRSITANPFFQMYQVFKDAPTAAAVTGLKNPLVVWGKIMTSFVKALNPNDEIVKTLKSYGIGGFQFAGRTAEKEFNLQMGVQQKQFTSKILSYLDHIGDASDYAQRRVIYEEVLKNTGNQTQALFQANAIIDFMRRGNSKAAQFEVRTVSFMNAFAQQIDVLGQAFVGGGLKGQSRAKAAAQFYKATAAFTGLTLLYCMMKGNDPDYQQLDNETKTRNFVLGKFKIPCSTSYSYFYKSIAELTYNYIATQGTASPEDATKYFQSMRQGALDSLLGPNPIPTAIRPTLEIVTNHDFFTGQAVVPPGMDKLDTFMKYNANTSSLGKMMSKASFGALNPMQMDHFIKGMTGTVGAITMWGSDVFTSDKPSRTWAQNPLIGSFVLPPVPHGPESSFYDLKTRADAKYETFMKLAMRQKPEEAQKYIQENKGLVAAYEYTSSIANQLTFINGEIQRMADVPSKDMSPAKKRELMTKYQETKNKILYPAIGKIRKDLAHL
jgi:hypothetical protein